MASPLEQQQKRNRIKRAVGAKPTSDIQPTKTPGVSASARNAASRTDRGASASLFQRRRRVRGSGRLARRDTA
jgi:hypothetical protein